MTSQAENETVFSEFRRDEHVIDIQPLLVNTQTGVCIQPLWAQYLRPDVEGHVRELSVDAARIQVINAGEYRRAQAQDDLSRLGELLSNADDWSTISSRETAVDWRAVYASFEEIDVDLSIGLDHATAAFLNEITTAGVIAYGPMYEVLRDRIARASEQLMQEFLVDCAELGLTQVIEPDAYTEKFELEKTEHCWRDDCGVVSSDDSETGLCDSHLTELKGRWK